MVATPQLTEAKRTCRCSRFQFFSKTTIGLIGFAFIIVSIVTTCVLTLNTYNRTESTNWVLVGGLSSTGATFRIRTSPGGGNVPGVPRKLVVVPEESDSDVLTLTEREYDVPRGGLVGSVTVADLKGETRYRYRTLSDDGTVLRTGSFRTPAAEGKRQNIKIAAAGCAVTGSKDSVFAHIADEDPLFFVHMGDFHYEDITANDTNVRVEAIGKVLGSSPQAGLFSSTALVYMWDDHDFLGDESDGTGPGLISALESYSLGFPYYEPLPASSVTSSDSAKKGNAVSPYHGFTIGTVRFIVSDLRSESKYPEYIMSPDQKAWLFDELSNSSAYDFVVWVTTKPWTGSPQKDDSWMGYPDERREVSEFINEAMGGPDGSRNLIAISSDAHMVAFDDGRNTYFGEESSNITSFPVLQTGPMDRFGSVKGGPFSHGCQTVKYEPAHQFSTVEFLFPPSNGEGGVNNDDLEQLQEPCLDIKSYSVAGSSKEVIFSKRICGKTFRPVADAGTGSCTAPPFTTPTLALMCTVVVLCFISIVMPWCYFDERRDALKVIGIIILTFTFTLALGLGIPFAMGAQSETLVIFIISLLQMIANCTFLYCWNRKLKRGGNDDADIEHKSIGDEIGPTAEASDHDELVVKKITSL